MLRHTVDVPSADKLRRDLKIRAELEKDKIKEELASVKKVSLALDRWSSPNRLAFLAIVVYYITDDFKYRYCLIGFELLQGPHEGSYFAEVVVDVMERYSIQLKLFAITTDNAANNGTLVSNLEVALRDVQYNINWESQVMHIPCLAHVVQLAVYAFLDNIKAFDQNGRDALENVREDTEFRIVARIDKSFQWTLSMVSNVPLLCLFLNF